MPKLWATRQLPFLSCPAHICLPLTSAPHIVGVYLLRGAALKLLKHQFYWGSGQLAPLAMGATVMTRGSCAALGKDVVFEPKDNSFKVKKNKK